MTSLITKIYTCSENRTKQTIDLLYHTFDYIKDSEKNGFIKANLLWTDYMYR